MPALLSLIGPAIPWLIGAAGVVGGLIAAWLHGRSTGVKSLQTVVATAQAQLAQQQAVQATAEAQAETAAAAAQQTATADRQQVDTAVAAMPSGDAQKELAADWSAPAGK